TACSLIASPEPIPSQCRCGYMAARVALAWASTAGCHRNVGTATPGPISPRVRSASAVSTFHTNGACPWAGTHGASTSEAITPVKPCCSARTPASTASVGGSCSKAAAYPIWTMRGSLLSNADGMTAAVHWITGAVHATADVLPCPGGSLRAPWLLVGHCGITMTNAPEQHPEVDVLLTGTVFFDLIFTGFPHPP